MRNPKYHHHDRPLLPGIFRPAARACPCYGGADKKRHYDGVGFLDALLVILPKANLKQILQEFRSILSWGFYFTLLQLDEQLVDLYYKRCEEAVGFLVKRDADGYCRCIQQVYMQLFHIIIHCAKRIGIRQCDAIQLPDIDSLPL